MPQPPKRKPPSALAQQPWGKLLLACALFALAGFLLFRFVREQMPREELSYYYDVSEEKLFTAPRRLVPPIQGVNDATEDAFRAVVFSTTGRPGDKDSHKIAYLEKCSPELKQHVEAIQRIQEADPTAPLPPKEQFNRVASAAHRFVRRLTDSQWYPLNSPEAEKILSEWQTAGAGGGEPVVCVP